jgi:hypothetical protein
MTYSSAILSYHLDCDIAYKKKGTCLLAFKLKICQKFKMQNKGNSQFAIFIQTSIKIHL